MIIIRYYTSRRSFAFRNQYIFDPFDSWSLHVDSDWRDPSGTANMRYNRVNRIGSKRVFRFFNLDRQCAERYSVILVRLFPPVSLKSFTVARRSSRVPARSCIKFRERITPRIRTPDASRLWNLLATRYARSRCRDCERACSESKASRLMRDVTIFAGSVLIRPSARFNPYLAYGVRFLFDNDALDMLNNMTQFICYLFHCHDCHSLARCPRVCDGMLDKCRMLEKEYVYV